MYFVTTAVTAVLSLSERSPLDCGPAGGDSGLASVAAGPSAASTGPTAPGGSLPSAFAGTIGSPAVEVAAPVVACSLPPPQPVRTSAAAASAIPAIFMDSRLSGSGSVGLGF